MRTAVLPETEPTFTIAAFACWTRCGWARRHISNAETRFDADQLANFAFAVVEGRLARVRADVVDQQRKFEFEVGDEVEHLEALFVFADVGGERAQRGVGKFLGQFVADRLEMSFVAGHKHHVGAERGQLAHGGQADAAACAGDQGSLSIESPAGWIHRSDFQLVRGRVGGADCSRSVAVRGNHVTTIPAVRCYRRRHRPACGVFVACAGCERSAVRCRPQTPPTPAKRPATVFDDQLKALDKAKAVEETLKKEQADRDKAIEDAGG